ncbi:protein tyrosine phosphatase family protein [Tateyamaria omphalii]|uniref:protein tyrosine phosphatase family protein n=1 Tax=Tateyamaria omphalii TaxID=299262 RepID=UPI001C99D3AF|nr:protein tyrosine phosphatase family protein [Tateyamaria omphalii]MBY5933819.1 protein tyrosine phosphatase family protein [Tateyamaria omphalii]
MSELTHILNWRRLNARLTTSGQPTEGQLADIRALGVTHIVNLGPHHNAGALEDEAGTVGGLGMKYIYIPVEFDAPTDADFEAFRHAIDANRNTLMHVHCIYNARVSAFFYRYAAAESGLSREAAFKNMESIWRPGSDWAAFIDDPAACGQPNRYAGEDY